MLSSELDFYLPPELIAQTPVEPRDSSRLLHFRRGLPREQTLAHRNISDLPEILRPGDLLVFNDTRVLRARVFGQRATGGKVEALLLQELERNVWSALLKPSARLRVGQEILLNGGEEEAEIEVPVTLLSRDSATWRIRFELPDSQNIRQLLPRLGQVPIPPYIKTIPREEQYQTVFSKEGEESTRNEYSEGALKTLDSSAAPTAGLHFSQELLQALQARGIRTEFLTLGVGMGTFQPVQTETLEEHVMHKEEFYVSPATAQAINEQKRKGKRVISVGTTTLRVLESVCNNKGMITAGSGATSIFIRPGFRFRCVDALLTNFHLPCSTLLALVAAFLENQSPESAKYFPGESALPGIAAIRYAYAQAIDREYRFFSFGDAMFIE